MSGSKSPRFRPICCFLLQSLASQMPADKLNLSKGMKGLRDASWQPSGTLSKKWLELLSFTPQLVLRFELKICPNFKGIILPCHALQRAPCT